MYKSTRTGKCSLPCCGFNKRFLWLAFMVFWGYAGFHPIPCLCHRCHCKRVFSFLWEIRSNTEWSEDTLGSPSVLGSNPWTSCRTLDALHKLLEPQFSPVQNGYNVLIKYFINSKQPLGQVLEKQGWISSFALLEWPGTTCSKRSKWDAGVERKAAAFVWSGKAFVSR